MPDPTLLAMYRENATLTPNVLICVSLRFDEHIYAIASNGTSRISCDNLILLAVI